MKTVIKSFMLVMSVILSASALAQVSDIVVGPGAGLPGATGIIVPVTLAVDGDNIAGIDMTVTFTTAAQYSNIVVDCGAQTVSASIFPSCSVAGNVVTIRLAETAGNAWISGLLANITVDIDGNAVPLVGDPLVALVAGASNNAGEDITFPDTTNGTFTVLAGPQPDWSSVPNSTTGLDFGSHDVDTGPYMMDLVVTNAAIEASPPLIGSCFMDEVPSPVNGATATVSSAAFSIVGDGILNPLTMGASDTITVQCDTTAAAPMLHTGQLACQHNGDGTTETSVTYYPLSCQVMGFQTITNFIATPPSPGVIDGTTTLTATGGASGNDVVFGTSTSGICTVDGAGLVTYIAAGTCTVTADQLGNADYHAAQQVTFGITVEKKDQLITGLASDSDPGVVDGTGTLSASADSGLDVTAFGSSTAAVCAVSGNTVTYLIAGTCTVTADQAGDAEYNAAPQVDYSFTVDPADQTITGLAANPDGGPVFGTSALSATASSGLAVSYDSSTTGVCTVSGTIVSYIAIGTCTITADQAGDANYNVAPQVTLDVTVVKADQAITGFSADPDGGSVDDTSTLNASGGASGNSVIFGSLTTDICTVSGNIVTYLANGACIVTADQTGDDDYNPAPQVTLEITVSDTNAIPTLSQWSLIALILLMLSIGSIVIRRRRMFN